MRPALFAMLLAMTATPVLAQDRAPALRQALVDLAYSLGQSHALRQTCEGEGDQFWRSRMMRMIDLEQPDASLDRRLKEAFNTGYATARNEHVRCGPASRRAEAVAASRGRALAGRLARVMNRVDAEPEAASAAMAEDSPLR